MDGDRFDQISRFLGRGVNRRAAVAALAALAAAGVGEAMAKHKHKHRRHSRAAGGNGHGGPGGNSDCAHFCASVFGADTPAAGQCTSDAAHGKGLCVTCAATNGGTLPAASTVCCPGADAAPCASYASAVCCRAADRCCSGTCARLGTNQNCTDCADVCVAPETCGGGPTGKGCGCTPNCTGKTCGDDDGCGGSCSPCPASQTCPQGGCCIATGSPTSCTANADCCSNICQGRRCVATLAGTCTAGADFCTDITNRCGSGICGCFQTTNGATLCGGAGAANCFDSCAACEAAGGGCVASVGACTLCGARVECIFPCPPSA